jgi:purine catabolism regulator
VRGLVDPAAARRWADAVLAPLRAYSEDGGSVDLVESLRTYLAHHGQWHPAAQQLGIHRHTLRYRMRRVEQLLDARLDDPQTRMDLWFALHPPPVDDHAGPPTGS